MAVDPVSEAVRNMRSNAIYSMQFQFVTGIQQAAAQGALRSKQLQGLAKALSADLIPPQTRTAAFERMGRNAQQSVIQAFTHRKNRRNIRDQAYRGRSERLGGGKLLRALRSPEFYQASPNGLRFINRRVLDREARHWKRLNYGAGSRAGDDPRPYKFEMLAQASIGLEPDPRPTFVVPPGYWIRNGERVPPGERGTAAFFHIGDTAGQKAARGRPTKVRISRGIEATNFLDPGVRRIANDLVPTLDGLYRQFYKDTASRAKFQETFKVNAPRPRRTPFKIQRR